MSSSPRTRPRGRSSGLVALVAAGALALGAIAFSTSFNTAFGAPSGSAVAPAAHAAADAASNDVIANLFEWNWPSVATECTTVLGPKGYGAVQVAPPQDSIRLAGSTHSWWDVYQPVGYDLNSRMGTEAQFASMVSACHAAGVKVYADTVINHTAGSNQTSTDSYGGDSFNPATYAYSSMGYTKSDFHFDPPCPNADLSIQDWNSVAQVQECQLLSLSDLYTEQDSVRSTLAAYLNKMEAYGVDGFRVDSAKHIAQADMAAILSKVNNTAAGVRPYVMQEVYPGSGGQLAPAAFEGNGNVLGFDYSYGIRSAFLGSISGLQNFGQGFEPSASDAVMVANHDLERNGTSLSYKDGATYTLATEFELAYGWGSTPSVYSGFDYSNNDQSPPADANGFVTNTVCGTGAWECLDRNQGVANLVGFHNATRGQAVGNWWSDNNNAIAFSRGSAGWISVNNEGSTVSSSYQTGLPAGYVLRSGAWKLRQWLVHRADGRGQCFGDGDGEHRGQGRGGDRRRCGGRVFGTAVFVLVRAFHAAVLIRAACRTGRRDVRGDRSAEHRTDLPGRIAVCIGHLGSGVGDSADAARFAVVGDGHAARVHGVPVQVHRQGRRRERHLGAGSEPQRDHRHFRRGTSPTPGTARVRR